MKILITGGSGFIGTNLISALLVNDETVLNLDIKKPQNPEQDQYWHYCDVTNFNDFEHATADFKPDLIIHLAARTDLVNSVDLKKYSVNIDGVANLIKICELHAIKKIIHFSSMLVHSRKSLYRGGKPNPDTDYGRSKLVGEQLILKSELQSSAQITILRPTSIWGPWFGPPYDQFFKFAARKILVLPSCNLAKKSFGYVGNLVTQTLQFVYQDVAVGCNKPMYLSDFTPVDIKVFFKNIREKESLPKAIYLPKTMFYLASLLGDILGKVGVVFPLNRYRWKNLTEDRCVDATEIVPIPTKMQVKLDDAIMETLIWLSKSK